VAKTRAAETREEAATRFWASVDRSGSCWLWTGPLDYYGYGTFYAEGRQWGAHRYALVLATGQNPPDRDASHHCDMPACVRDGTGHLLWETRRQNMIGCYQRRAAATKSAKLTPDLVRSLRDDHRQGLGYYRLSRKYGITESAALAIVKRRTWKWIED
jgi:hypothetical protein